jgi:hypothetical protein
MHHRQPEDNRSSSGTCSIVILWAHVRCTCPKAGSTLWRWLRCNAINEKQCGLLSRTRALRVISLLRCCCRVVEMILLSSNTSQRSQQIQKLRERERLRARTANGWANSFFKATYHAKKNRENHRRAIPTAHMFFYGVKCICPEFIIRNPFGKV